MILKFLSCLLLSFLTVTTCFLLGYLVIWVYEKATRRSADLDIIAYYVWIVIMIAIILMGC